MQEAYIREQENKAPLPEASNKDCKYPAMRERETVGQPATKNTRDLGAQNLVISKPKRQVR